MKKSGAFLFGTAVVLVASFVFGTGAFLPRQVLADFDCLTLSPGASSEQRQYCQNQVNQLEAELKELNNQLAQQKNQSGSLAGDIKVLQTKIAAKTAEIKSKNIKISQLSDSISEKKASIVSLSEKIETQKESLAQLIRKTNEMDFTTTSHFLLSGDTLSDFYEDVSRYDTLKSKVKSSVDSINTIKGVTEQKKTELEKEQDKAVDEKQNLIQVQKGIQQDQATQKQLLAISKNKEAQYQKVIAEQQAKVAQIKSKLFSLAGGSQSIRFDVALQYANEASQKTGIDPAFLLAELTQESNLGSNVGKCYISDTSSGRGVNVNSGKTYTNVMKPSRDIPPFLEITSKLGFDPLKTVVSCPIAGVAGYGGAMGPAQFIPSTWKLFENRLQADLGHYPNPWFAEDAFMAAALYLTDLGAVGTSASAQLRASCKYYGSGGKTCSYGRSVQNLKVGIQADIDYLNQYGVSRR